VKVLMPLITTPVLNRFAAYEISQARDQ